MLLFYWFLAVPPFQRERMRCHYVRGKMKKRFQQGFFWLKQNWKNFLLNLKFAKKNEDVHEKTRIGYENADLGRLKGLSPIKQGHWVFNEVVVVEFF